jgi:hypothetical protein
MRNRTGSINRPTMPRLADDRKERRPVEKQSRCGKPPPFPQLPESARNRAVS